MSGPSSSTGRRAIAAADSIYSQFPSRDEVYPVGASIVVGYKDRVPMVCVVERSWAQDGYRNIQLPKVEQRWNLIDRYQPERLTSVSFGPPNRDWAVIGRTLVAHLKESGGTEMRFHSLPGIQPLPEDTPPIENKESLDQWRKSRYNNTETRIFVYRLDETVDPSSEWLDFQQEPVKMYLMPFNEAFARRLSDSDRKLYTLAAQLLLMDKGWYFPKDSTIPGILNQLGAVACETDGQGPHAYLTRVYFEGRSTGF